jgi:hypothetical protein
MKLTFRQTRRGVARGLAGDLAAAVEEVRRSLGVEAATRRFLLSAVIPLWLGAALADWDRHRRTHIETTAGTHESAIHTLMMIEAGLPAMMGLFLEVNAGVLATAVGALGVHEATAIWDVSYAEERRRVTPTEQHIHSLLEVVPLMATAFLLVLHWDQARALLGQGPRPADFTLRPKRHPLPARYLRRLIAAIVACVGMPYAEEFRRCYQADHTLAAHPAPPIPATGTLRIPVEGQPSA